MKPNMRLRIPGPIQRSYAGLQLPPGFRFAPNDSLLINDYLMKKINNQQVPPAPIRSINIYNHSPRNLTEAYPSSDNNGVWYFFTPRDRKRLYRVAGDGYWKYFGTRKRIYHDDICIGFKKFLIFYEGKPRMGKETLWVMKEYIVNQPPRQQNGMLIDNCVVCRIHRRTRRQSLVNKNKWLRRSFAKPRKRRLISENDEDLAACCKRLRIEHNTTFQCNSNHNLEH